MLAFLLGEFPVALRCVCRRGTLFQGLWALRGRGRNGLLAQRSALQTTRLSKGWPESTDSPAGRGMRVFQGILVALLTCRACPGLPAAPLLTNPKL